MSVQVGVRRRVAVGATLMVRGLSVTVGGLDLGLPEEAAVLMKAGAVRVEVSTAREGISAEMAAAEQVSTAQVQSISSTNARYSRSCLSQYG